MPTKKEPPVDLAAFDSQDEADLEIRHPKTNAPIGWVWTFYGPAHAVTRELASRAMREALARANDDRMARLNGRAVEVSPDDPEKLRADTIDAIAIRTKAFSPVRLNGELIEFSPDAARKLLSDPRKGWLLNQASDFLKAEANFIRASANA